eukprot:TRINITY_DN12106_c0_g1_i3.p1 TRINITY_DN12106_c0_g1~~TRINITY_DN12106_c0_g1_i3.p1  ORF type:complete len:250 (-),score=56.12 TRINITY_DN12106_c0_g1_i3:286-1035(-)
MCIRDSPAPPRARTEVSEHPRPSWKLRSSEVLYRRKRIELLRVGFERWAACPEFSRAMTENDALAAQVRRLERELVGLREAGVERGALSREVLLAEYREALDSRVTGVQALLTGATAGSLVCAVLEAPSILGRVVAEWRVRVAQAIGQHKFRQMEAEWSERAASANGLETHAVLDKVSELEVALRLRSQQLQEGIFPTRFRPKIDALRRAAIRCRESCGASSGALTEAREQLRKLEEGCRQMSLALGSG